MNRRTLQRKILKKRLVGQKNYVMNKSRELPKIVSFLSVVLYYCMLKFNNQSSRYTTKYHSLQRLLDHYCHSVQEITFFHDKFNTFVNCNIVPKLSNIC